MKKNRKQFFLFFCLAFLFLGKSFGFDPINKFQKTYLESQIVAELNQLILNWKEERYLDGLYQQGEEMSRRVITQKQFADEMVAKKWILQNEVGKLEIEKVEFQNLMMADVYVTLKFKHTINVDSIIKKQAILKTTLDISENNNQWKFDLIQLIDLPY